MKHIELYEKFNDSGIDEIKTLREILLELSDIGYEIEVNYTPSTLAGSNKYDQISVQICNIDRFGNDFKNLADNRNKYIDKKLFILDTKEDVLRIKHYMKSRGWDFIEDYFTNGNTRYHGYIKRRLKFTDRYIK